MRKKLLPMIFSFLLVFTMFVGVPVLQASASNADNPAAEIQRKTKNVTVNRPFDKFPPPYIFYSSGGYEGYLGLSSYYRAGSGYIATYTGTVYDGPPYPIPTTHSTHE